MVAFPGPILAGILAMLAVVSICQRLRLHGQQPSAAINVRIERHWENRTRASKGTGGARTYNEQESRMVSYVRAMQRLIAIFVGVALLLTNKWARFGDQATAQDKPNRGR